jgi:hypothetical protein
MKKHLFLVFVATASIVVSIKPVASFPRPNFPYPTASHSKNDQLVCYMQTADGRTLNLAQLCSRSTPRAQVVISRMVREDNVLVGNVVNQTGKSVRNVQVIYEILNRQRDVIQRSSSPTEPSNLGSGQTALFELIGEDGQNIRIVSLKWDE